MNVDTRTDRADPAAETTGRTPGGPLELWALALPIIVALLSQSLMGVVDTFFMGRVGTAEQGGVGLGSILLVTLVSLFSGTLTGITTYVAQHHGARDFAKVGRDGRMGLQLAVPGAIILLLLAPGVGRLLDLVGATPAVLPHAADYLFIRLSGAIFFLVNYATISFLRGIGDTRTPMLFTLGANTLNIGLNYVLVLGNLGFPALGARGAALASVIATGVASVGYLMVFFSGSRARRFQTRRMTLAAPRELLGFLRVGVPIGVAFFIEIMSWAVFMAVVSRLGEVELAATNIVIQLLHFSFMGAVGLGTAATTLVGQYLGAERLPVARRAARSAILSAAFYCTALGVLLLVFRYPILSLFNADPAVITVGARLVIYAALFQFFDGLGIGCSGIVRGAGDTRWPMILTVILSLGVFVPLSIGLSGPAGLGVDGAWIAAAIFLTALGMGLYGRYRSGRWQKMRV